MSERLARAALSRVGEPGDVRLTRLVTELGAEQVYEQLRAEQDLGGVHTDIAVRLRGIHPERDVADAARKGIRLVCPGDSEWPAPVGDLAHAEPLQSRGGVPVCLWVKGPLRLDQAVARAAAVVGSRSATTYGTGVAADVAARLAAEGMAVISGAAFGIDQAAHRGALAARGPTVAVLACGVDRAYPSAHRNLLDYIAEVGLVVSEVPPGGAPTKVRFLARNRLIAALAQGTVVVEAAIRSGALNTANWATRLHRVLMGVPGPVTSAPSQGVHELIRSHGAELVTRGEEVLELLSPAGSFLAPVPRGPERLEDRLTDRERQVLDAVPVVQPAGGESLARVAGIAHRDVDTAMQRLQSLGLVEATPRGWRRVSPDPTCP